MPVNNVTGYTDYIHGLEETSVMEQNGGTLGDQLGIAEKNTPDALSAGDADTAAGQRRINEAQVKLKRVQTAMETFLALVKSHFEMLQRVTSNIGTR